MGFLKILLEQTYLILVYVIVVDVVLGCGVNYNFDARLRLSAADILGYSNYQILLNKFYEVSIELFINLMNH